MKPTKENMLNATKSIFLHGDGSRQELIAEFAEKVFLEAATDWQPEILAAAAVVHDEESDQSQPLSVTFSMDTYTSLERRFSEFVGSYVSSLSSDNLDENEFYEKLTKFVVNSVFHKKEEKWYALARILNDRCLPYFQIGSVLSMTDNDFKDAQQRLRPMFKRMLSALRRDYKQRTHKASVLLAEINTLQQEADKVVYLSRLIAILEDENSLKLAALLRS